MSRTIRLILFIASALGLAIEAEQSRRFLPANNDGAVRFCSIGIDAADGNSARVAGAQLLGDVTAAIGFPGDFYLGITSRASLLDTTSRSSLRFLPASSMASREP